MYALIDRPVATLASADAFLLAATRGWVQALTFGRDPLRVVHARFAAEDMAPAAADFHIAMAALDSGSADEIAIQRPCHERVEETEAVLLGLWRLVSDDRLADATAAARLLVDRDAARRMIAAMTRTAAAMRPSVAPH